MPIAHAVATALLAASSSSSKTNGGSGALSLVFLVVIFAVAYFAFLRPRSQAARRQRETLTEIVAGDEVLSGAGIFGRVLDVEADRVTIETAPGTRITVLRSTIARKLNEPPDDDAYDHEDEYEHDEHDEYGEDEHEHEHDEYEHGDHDEADEYEHGDHAGAHAESEPGGEPVTDESHTDEASHSSDEPGKRRAGGDDH